MCGKEENAVTEAFASVKLGMAKVQTEAGFERRLSENQRRVFQIAYSVLGNRSDAEEVAQETFLRAYQNLRSLRDEDKFRSWVNRIAFRLALNRQRATRRQVARDTNWHGDSGIAEAADPGADAERRLQLAELRRAIEELPDKFRIVLQLCVVEDMDATQVGAVLGLPPGTVRSRMHTARKLLLEAMK